MRIPQPWHQKMRRRQRKAKMRPGPLSLLIAKPVAPVFPEQLPCFKRTRAAGYHLGFGAGALHTLTCERRTWAARGGPLNL